MIETLRLIRVASHFDGVFGVLIDDNQPFAVTCEPADNRADGHFPIPIGLYWCRRSIYHKGGYETFEIVVPGRTEIKFHKLNLGKETQGCIGVGERFGQLEGHLAILECGAALHELMLRAGDQAGFNLEVKWGT